MHRSPRGLTLIEIMIVIAIIGILVAVAIPRYVSLQIRSREASTKGGLGSLRSALSIYYGDNESFYPVDDLSALTADSKYIPQIPLARIAPLHEDTTGVTPEGTPTETGGWSYDNALGDLRWGQVRAGCLHSDSRGTVWSTY